MIFSPLCHDVITKQFDWVVVKVYVKQSKRAKVEECEIPPIDSNRPYWRASGMVSPQESSEEGSSSESEGGNRLPKIAESTGGKRENFLEEEDIPLAEEEKEKEEQQKKKKSGTWEWFE